MKQAGRVLFAAAMIWLGVLGFNGVMPRLAAALSTMQLALFGILVWIPRVIAGNLSAFQFGEFVVTFVLMSGAWVVTDSYSQPATNHSSAR